MTQFLVSPDCFDGGGAHIRGPQARRLLKVMRFRTGDLIKLFDGARRFEVLLKKESGPSEIQAEILRELPPSLPRLSLLLFFALLPKDRTEAVLEKGTEVGVSEFFPIYSQRTNVRLAAGSGLEAKLSRWKKTVEAAVEQSESSFIPDVHPPMSFAEALGCRPEIPAWIACPPASPNNTVPGTVLFPSPETASARLFIGPEGGFSPEELKQAERRGAGLFSLGGNVLRSETAAIAASSLILLG